VVRVAGMVEGARVEARAGEVRVAAMAAGGRGAETGAAAGGAVAAGVAAVAAWAAWAAAERAVLRSADGESLSAW